MRRPRPKAAYSNWRNKNKGHAIANRVAPMSDFGGGSFRRVPALKDNDQGYSLAYKAISDVFACVNLRAESICKLNIKVVRAGTDIEVENTAWHEAVNQNMDIQQQDLMYLIEYGLSIWGETFLLKLVQIEDERTPGGLQWLNPQVVELMLEDGYLLGFEYTGGDGVTHPFQRKQVGYYHYTDSDDDNAGLPPLRASLDAANIKRNSQAFIEAFFANDATVGGILTGRSTNSAFGTSSIPLTEDDRKQIIKEWKAQNTGAHKAFRTVMLPWDLQYERVGGEPPTQQIELTTDQRRNIHQVYHVPMSMTQASDASDPLSSGSTISKDEAKFWSGWAIPEHERLLLFLNTAIMPWLAPGLELVGDYSDILGMISDTAERRDMWRTDALSGLMSVNRYLELTGEEKIDTGDVLYVPGGVIVTPINQLGAVIVEEEVIEEGEPPEDETTPLLLEPSEEIPGEPNEARSLILEEYASWHNFVKKRTKSGKNRQFEHRMIPQAWVDETQELLIEAGTNLNDIDRIFRAAMKYHKTAQSRLLTFQNSFEDWMANVASGKLLGGRATNALNNLWTVQGRLMFSEGLIEGGTLDGIPDITDKASIQKIINNQRPFIRRLRAELAAGNITKDQMAGKVQSWGNQFTAFFQEGLTSANKNQMLECVGDDGVNSCRTCQKIKGVIARAGTWERRELRPGIDHRNFECGTYESCHHILVPVKAKALGVLPTEAQVRAWATKTHDHECGDLPPLDQQPYTMEQYDMYYETNGYEAETHYDTTIIAI